MRVLISHALRAVSEETVKRAYFPGIGYIVQSGALKGLL